MWQRVFVSHIIGNKRVGSIFFFHLQKRRDCQNALSVKGLNEMIFGPVKFMPRVGHQAVT